MEVRLSNMVAAKGSSAPVATLHILPGFMSKHVSDQRCSQDVAWAPGYGQNGAC